MIQNSQDIFWVVLAFCVLWFTLFVSWMVYYLAMILKETRKIIRFFSATLAKIDEVVSIVKEKLNKSAASFTLLLKAGQEVMDFIKEKRGSGKKKQEKKEPKTE
ncbi:MAG: hypothetical protein V1684_00595 [bacterium]